MTRDLAYEILAVTVAVDVHVCLGTCKYAEQNAVA
jgi:hypothetical protein